MAKNLAPMRKIELFYKGNGDAPHGESVTCWPVDKAGWAKLGYLPEGAEAPAGGIGIDLLKMTVSELKDVAKKESLGLTFDSKAKKDEIVNLILTARAKETGDE